MTGLPIPANVIGLDLRGTLTICDNADCTLKHKVVFQGCSEASANYFVGNHSPRMMRAYVIPNDPKTSAQLACRAKFASAVANWTTLSTADKSYWSERGRARNLSGWNEFISEFMKA